MRTRIVALAVLASVLATCLFAVPLAVAVLEYAIQHERGHLVRIASDVAIDVSGDVYDRDPVDRDDLDVDDDYSVAVDTPSTVRRDVAVIWAAMVGLAAAAVRSSSSSSTSARASRSTREPASTSFATSMATSLASRTR